MIPRQFDYFDPTSLSAVLELLGQYGEDSKLLAGGQSLLPMMKFRLVSPKVLIDLWRIPDLAYIQERDGEITIGAMTTHYALQSSTLLQQKLSVLADAAQVVGDSLVRNLGTIGGSAAHAAPNADYPGLLVALGAKMNIVGPRGERSVPAADFFKDIFTTSLEPDEVLKAVLIPLPSAKWNGAYLKLSRRGTDFAIVSVTAILESDDEGRCKDARVVLGGLTQAPLRATLTESLLRGRTLTPKLLKEAGDTAVEGIEAISDVQADSQYRLDVAKVYVRRALRAAWDRTS